MNLSKSGAGRGPTLHDLLACPLCKTKVRPRGDGLACEQCGRTYPVVDGVPIMLPEGKSGKVEHEAVLNTQTSYFPWVYRVVLQSLLDNQVTLEIGSGERAVDHPNIIRMDVKLTPHVDVVGDAHAMPFLPESFDFIFSIAVFEHLRQPFAAADEIYRVLRDGGYICHDCNFVFAYHGYPHHYFNASMQGLEQIFRRFRILRQGVAPYQMPSFALDMILATYMAQSKLAERPEAEELLHLLNTVRHTELTDYDKYFSEEQAAYVAAGTFVFGMKQTMPEATVIPAPIWALRERFPVPENLGTTDNLLRWAAEAGRREYPEIDAYLRAIEPFSKRGDRSADRTAIRSLPWVEPKFGTIRNFPEHAPLRRQPIPKPKLVRLNDWLARKVRGLRQS